MSKRFVAYSVLAISLAAGTVAADVKQVMLEYRIVKAPRQALEELGVAVPPNAQAFVAPERRLGFDLDVLISQLEEAKRVRLASRPMVMVQAGERAEIESGGPSGFLKLAMRASVKVPGPTELEFASSGVTVSAEPHVTADDNVVMELKVADTPVIIGDFVFTMNGEDASGIAFQRDGVELPASIVQCPEAGECVVVFAHAYPQREQPTR